MEFIFHQRQKYIFLKICRKFLFCSFIDERTPLKSTVTTVIVFVTVLLTFEILLTKTALFYVIKMFSLNRKIHFYIQDLNVII